MQRLVLIEMVFLAAIGVACALFLPGVITSSAVQDPTSSLDMIAAGNSYADPGLGGADSMAVGAINNCLTSATGDVATHNHNSQLIIQNVEDLVGFQVRLNYIGDKMRPSVFHPTPFVD